jgi:hypothetical protein
VKGFADRAQLVNYDQYRALMEGHLAHIWEWYTGLIIWKTQNPWTAMRGQMYDPYLDPNAGLYGLHHANVPLHVMCDPTTGMLMVVNNTFRPCHDLMVQARTFDRAGKDTLVFQWFVEIGPSTMQKIESLGRVLKKNFAIEGGFLELRLLDVSRRVLDRNLYWYPDSTGTYTGLQCMPVAEVEAIARSAESGKIDLSIENPPGGPLAFFLRVSLVDPVSGKRILPVFYSDNYISVLPGENETITIECPSRLRTTGAFVSVSGWNVPEKQIRIE